MLPEEAVRLIASNEITEFDIDWRGYQRLVWWLVRQETSIQAEPTYRSEITHGEDAGVIDIVVRLTSPPITLFGDDSLSDERQIFIECKQYRATLTLDKVGKVFCHSILEEPEALWIVSPRRLSTQANDYAKRIFRTNGAAVRTPLLRRTRFRHWQLRELVDRRLPSRAAVRFHVADWQIVQSTPFGTAIVASARSAPHSRERQVSSDSRATYLVRLFVDGSSSGAGRVELAFECDKPQKSFIALRNRVLPGTDEINADIPSIDISGQRVTSILVKDTILGTEQRIDVGRLAFQVFAPTIIELRPQTASTIAERLAYLEASYRVVCFAGHAGVGKSTLLEQVAWILAREHDWDVRAHTLSENTDYSLFFDLVEWFALATAAQDFIEAGPGAQDPRHTIISTIAYHYSGLQTPDAVQQLIETAARGALNDAQVQQLVRILGRIAKARETPLLVVLRDMHSASPAIQKALLQLFLRLRDDGWGNVRFIIEARRDADSTGLIALDGMSRIAERLGSDFTPIDVSPLSLEELHASLRPHLSSPDFGEMVRRLHQLTGGYPLLVDQLLRDLLARAIVTKTGTDPDHYSIDPNALKGLRLERVAPQIWHLLRDRIERVARSTYPEIMAACLGITAQILRVAPEGAPRSLIVDLVAAALGGSVDRIEECLQLATSLNFLRPEDAGRAVAFTNEATRSMAAEFARGQPGFLRVIARSANSNVLPQILGRFRSDLLQAYLALEVGQVRDALRFALTAEAGVMDTGNLIQRRLALECAIDTLTSNNRPDSDWARNELAARERLIWTVMQQASQHFARSTIESSERRISSMHATGLISASERAVAAFHYARCRVVIGTRSLDAPALLHALPPMCVNALDPAQIHYALTRLILVAIEVDDVASASRGIEYCLRLPVLSSEPDVRLSFLSEIGDMFAIDAPETELAISQTAFELAESLLESGAVDARSHAHAMVNLLSARARHDPMSLDETYLQLLSQEFGEQGFLNPLIRLMNLAGLVAATGSQGANYSRAIDLWTNCKELAEATGHQTMLWQVVQNLAAVHTRQDVTNASTIFRRTIDDILDPFLRHADQLRELVTRLLDDFARAAPLAPYAIGNTIPVTLDAIRNVRHVSSISWYRAHRERHGDQDPPYLF